MTSRLNCLLVLAAWCSIVDVCHAVAPILDDFFGYQLPGASNHGLWWCEATYKVGRQRRIPVATKDTITISAARNEYEPFQLVLKPDVTLSNVTISVGDFSPLEQKGSVPYSTAYFRCNFTLPPGPKPAYLNGRLLRDDGAMVYLNGFEVHRNNLPGGIGSTNVAAPLI